MPSLWVAIGILGTALAIATTLYILVGWRHAPYARNAMLALAVSCFLAGALLAAWFASALAPSTRLAEAPTRPATIHILSPPEARNAPFGGYHCGSDRWAVKTLSDPDADKVSFSPVRATVTQLVSISRPTAVTFRWDQRVPPVEVTTYVVRALAVKFKGESDHDIHVIIVDPDNYKLSLVTEFVDAGCEGAANSRARELFRRAAVALAQLFPPPSQDSPTISISGQQYEMAELLGFKPTFSDPLTGQVFMGPRTGTPPPALLSYATVEVTGVGYWDDEHGVEGAAANGIELHPVLGIRRAD